ncbi:hypothetical protein MJO28_003007 [Puccinia striiformis f. sp. tritici]|uniref:Phosphatidylserine synthase 2 n=2 Tax=Puccinia striiformis f. sp. tritici TaxID=168172 RepID=A0A0L0VAN4_9BASI|nr:hypothetical protein Pst134EB_006119 [Puccinia striiformis f. sp. tritici]KAI9620023.1 hypothetical protein H4Q26_014005 [Puccinia striiformis f. sp. tritici PST-130]KNE96322.1 hypothetical protein PSTG_10441 [Puccinia striiformis f. sp. tritici PST-78]KAI7959216.1 hypothetical protein MJO28_003007 [Puccinia striiformis f. sp. tritici]KAI7964981.1 hypothetical protein MJO29_003079 [Puccinia striiformis f. sp. tritici]
MTIDQSGGQPMKNRTKEEETEEEEEGEEQEEQEEESFVGEPSRNRKPRPVRRRRVSTNTTTNLIDQDQEQEQEQDDDLFSDDPAHPSHHDDIDDRPSRNNPFFFGQPDDKLEPYQMKHDDSVKWVYTPSTLTAAAIGTSVLASLAYNSHIFPRSFRSHLGVISGVTVFLVFCMLNFRDGPFRRPHPAFWRIVLGLNLLYVMLLSFLYWTDKSTARELIRYFDPSLGVPLPEKSYAEHCEFTPTNVWQGIDIFCLAHSLGWFAKAVVLRDHWFCWILSVGFEVMEYSLQHHLPNFAECWWDHWLLDVLICNWGGLWLGMKTCEWLRVSPFSWRGLGPVVVLNNNQINNNDNNLSSTATTRRRAAKYAARQFTPHDWTEFRWEGTKRFRNYIATVALLTVFLLSELNVFYLKSLLWLAPEHPIVILRLAAMFLWALPAVREYYDYATYTKRVKRMGSHAWLSMATVILELLIVIKWSKGEFESSFMPVKVKIFWSITLSLLILYPAIKFGLPTLKSYNQSKLASNSTSSAKYKIKI